MAAVEYTRFASHCRAIYESPRYSPKTRRKMEQLLGLLARLGVQRTDEMTTGLFRSYVAYRLGVVSSNTVRGELTYLRTCVNEAIDKRWLRKAPKWRKLWPPRSPRRRKVLHTVEEVHRVQEHLRSGSDTWEGFRLYALFVLVAHTGVRLGEAQQGQVQDLDLERGTFEIAGRDRVKTPDSVGLVPLPEASLPILREWRCMAGSVWLFPERSRRGPWTSGGRGRKPTQRLKAAAQAVGVEGMTFQSLRHTFATWATWRFGLSGPQLKRVLRHTTEETQAEYVHLPKTLDDLARAVDRVDYRASASST